MTRILVIRHPETLANAERRLIGTTDSPWTELGRRQARALKMVVDEVSPREVWSSPAPRALRAAHAATPCTVPLRIVEELREIDFGLAEGLTFDEASRAGLHLQYRPSAPSPSVRHDPLRAEDGEIAPGGEDWPSFQARVDALRDALTEASGTVCVFTHGGTGRAVIAALLALPLDAMWSFALPTAGIAQVRLDEGLGTLEKLWAPQT
ncbi:MAG: histidine phosphatase family protein [Anaerosomatales bacterium]|nr:histidine phosphatase family protein [Anaerosomatales bacterium]